MKTFKNFIGGDWVPPVGGEYFENLNPADRTDAIGRFPLSNAVSSVPSNRRDVVLTYGETHRHQRVVTCSAASATS